MPHEPRQHGVGQNDNPFRVGRSLQPKKQRRERVARRQIIVAERTLIYHMVAHVGRYRHNGVFWGKNLAHSRACPAAGNGPLGGIMINQGLA